MRNFKSLLLALIALVMMASLKICNSSLHHVDIPEDGSPALIFSTETLHDVQRSYIAAIKEAKKSILVLVYTITDKHVIRALREKAEEGVDVTIICHQDISYDIEKRAGSKIKVLKRFGKGLMHLKIMVIDGKKSFIGSANMTNASLKMYGNLVTAFDSEALGSFLTEKALSIGKYKNSRFFQNRHFKIGGQLVEFFFLPDDKTASIRIKELIRGATKTIRVAMFTFTREDFAKELIHASLKGVDVEVFLDNSSSKGSSIQVFDLLNNSLISLKLNKGPGLLHYKFAYIDGKTLINGSANWTRNAFNTNDDCFVVIHDLNKDQQLEMEHLWKTIRLNSI